MNFHKAITDTKTSDELFAELLSSVVKNPALEQKIISAMSNAQYPLKPYQEGRITRLCEDVETLKEEKEKLQDIITNLQSK